MWTITYLIQGLAVVVFCAAVILLWVSVHFGLTPFAWMNAGIATVNLAVFFAQFYIRSMIS